MDEVSGITEAAYAIPLPIPDPDMVLRQVHKNDLDKESHRFPKASHFKLRDNELELSVNWNTLITIKEVFYIIGISFNTRQMYKDFRQFEVFKFPVSFLRQLETIEKVIHSPVFKGNPAPVGSPNNYAHASIYYPDDEETRIKLSNYCNDDYAESFCPMDYESLEPIVEDLRNRLNKTAYHRCRIDVD